MVALPLKILSFNSSKWCSSMNVGEDVEGLQCGKQTSDTPDSTREVKIEGRGAWPCRATGSGTSKGRNTPLQGAQA